MSTSQSFNSPPTEYSSPSHPPRPPTSNRQRESLRLNHDVYLVDFNVFRPPEELRLRIEEISDAWNINACTEVNRQLNEEKARAALEGSGGSGSIRSIAHDEAIKEVSIDGNGEEEGTNINGFDSKSRHIKNSAKGADGISHSLPLAAEPSGPADEEAESATDSKESKTVSASVNHPPQELMETLSGVKVFAQKGMSMEEALSVVEFQKKIFEKSGLGENNTFLPKSIHPKYCGENPRTDLEAAGQECFMATTGALRGLFERTKLRPSDIDIIVTTCSIYCPTPSMASMLVNAFGLKSSIQSYHLAGMGCGNGVIAINLVSDLLKARPQGANAILVTTETTTPAFYRGADKHRLVTNVLFRMGAAAILLSNKPEMRQRAKYRLTHKVRVHTSASEDSYRCIWYGPDEQGINGIYLGKNIVKEAGRGVTLALRHIAPYAMSWGEIGRFVSLQVQEAFRNGRREGHGASRAAEVGEISKGHLATTPSLPDNPPLSNHPNAANTTTTTTTTINHASSDKDEDPMSAPPPKGASSSNTSALKSFRPKFNENINHFLVHAGGAKVLDGLGKELRLEERDLIPSRAVLHDYGNVSSSTTWYTLAYIESCRGVAAGERVLQVGVGSGVKCGVNLWTALRDIDDVHEAWEHREEARTSRDVKTAALSKQLSVSAKDSERINAKDGIVNPSPKKDDFEKLVETNAHYYQGSATSASLRMRRRGIYKFPNIIAAYDYARPYIRLLCIIALAVLVIMYFRNGRLSGGDGHSGLSVKQQVSEMQGNQDIASSLVDKGMKRMAYDWRVSRGEDGGKGKDEVLQMVKDTVRGSCSGGGGSEVVEELGKRGAVLHPDL